MKKGLYLAAGEQGDRRAEGCEPPAGQTIHTSTPISLEEIKHRIINALYIVKHCIQLSQQFNYI